MYRKLIGACVGLAMMGMVGTANAVPIVVGGQLVGATNVDVGGTFYDVTFVEGSCNTLFNGCDPSEFTFTTMPMPVRLP